MSKAAAAAKSLQSCPTLHDPIDGSLPGFSIRGILQARTLEWGAISFSNAWKWKVKVKSLSHARLLATLWTATYQAPPFMGFSRQESWSRVPLPWASQMALVAENLPASAEDLRDEGSIPGSGRSPGGGHGSPLQYFCLENPHGQRSLAGYSPWIAKSQTWQKWLSTHAHHACQKLRQAKTRPLMLSS